MKNSISNSPYKTILLIIISFLITIFLNNCTTVKPLTATASYYRFILDGNNYKIRSIFSSDKNHSYNELIGNKFVAVDFDKDRIIDRIMIGNADIAKAQKIYEYGLEMLSRDNKLKVSNIEKALYSHENTEFDYQIKSFHPKGEQPFNEFMIIKKHDIYDGEIVILDQNADGNLDEVLKGPADVDTFQANYAYVINTGLKKNKLVKSGNMILVKEN